MTPQPTNFSTALRRIDTVLQAGLRLARTATGDWLKPAREGLRDGWEGR